MEFKLPETSNSFTGQIRVAARIIDYLSSGLYHTPAACLKELINNSYDAGAQTVNVFVKPDANRIIIEDDGDGMSRDEFVRHFDHVSESHKRDNDSPLQYGRRKIGKIGIGFIAANEICDHMELFSTKRNSRELLHVSINFAEMRKSPEERRVDGTPEFVKADYDGEILEAEASEHFTRLFLTSVRGEAKNILAGARHSASIDASAARSLYGRTHESIEEVLKTRPLKSWKVFDAYSETMLQIGLNVPVAYHDNWIPSSIKREVEDITKRAAALHFSVSYDGTELRKPIVFPNGVKCMLDRFSFQGKHVSADGYFYVQHGTIAPRELHGLLVRIRNAAVGEFDTQFWGFPPTEAPLIQRWVSAEIYADDGLEAAMNIDRRTLREAHPAYAELRNAIHDHLRKVLKRARQRLYSEASKNRKKERATTAYTDVLAYSRNELRQMAPKVAKIVEARWTTASESSKQVAMKKLSVMELYELVVTTANEVLSADDARKLIARLTEKLLS